MYSPNVFFFYRNLSFTDSCLSVFVWGWRLIVDPVTCLPFEICYVHCYFMWLQLLAFEYLNQILFHEFNLDHNIISEDAFKIAFSGLMKADISSPQCAGSVCLLCLQKACKTAEHRQPLPEFSWYVQSFENGIKHPCLVGPKDISKLIVGNRTDVWQ